MPRLFFNIFYKTVTILYFAAFTIGIFQIRLKIFFCWTSFNIMNIVPDTEITSKVGPKLSSSPWKMAPDWYVLMVLLSTFSILFPIICASYTACLKKNDLIFYLLFKKYLLSFFLSFSFIFSLKSMCFWLFWLSYITNCLGENPSVGQSILEVLSTTLWHQESFVPLANVCHSSLASVFSASELCLHFLKFRCLNNKDCFYDSQEKSNDVNKNVENVQYGSH